MRALRNERGQLVIPAMLIFPSLFLFVWLIFDTAKLSREKIKNQFAMDAAAFVEMTNYSDFLNRTAYVNGAFPMRIFAEGYGDFRAECEGKHDHCREISYAEILYRNGMFPRSVSGVEKFENEGKWDIRYGGAGASKNSSPPDMPELAWLFTKQDSIDYWHSWDLATEIYKLYVQIYQLLGSVEQAQYTVLKRLAQDHSFMRKSFFLNTNDQVNAQVLVADFRAKVPNFAASDVVRPVCLLKMNYCGTKFLGGTGIQTYSEECVAPTSEPATGFGRASSEICGNNGLFQLMWVKDSEIAKLRDQSTGEYPGLPLMTTWEVPARNYWGIDFLNMSDVFPKGRPELHTTISVRGDPSASPAVWPDPTPKFQVRQFP